MTDEKVKLAQGTAMATRVGTLESATDFILQHDKTVEKFAKIEVLEGLRETMESEVLSSCGIAIYVNNMIRLLKAGD